MLEDYIINEQIRYENHYLKVAQTDWLFLKDEIDALDDDQRQLWAQWMLNWHKYITRQLKPEKQLDELVFL